MMSCEFGFYISCNKVVEAHVRFDFLICFIVLHDSIHKLSRSTAHPSSFVFSSGCNMLPAGRILWVNN